MEIEKETTGEGERRRSIGEELPRLVFFFLFKANFIKLFQVEEGLG
jgi:hypothetical protein